MRLLAVDEQGAGQRIDNFVRRHCPDVPKTRLYRAMRKGEIRVNKGRVRPDHRLNLGDTVRLPPLETGERAASAAAPPGWQRRLADAVVLRDDDLLVIDKPSGLAVHGGSGLNFGLIETLRAMYPQERYLELVHRLDRDTSGLIMVARRPAALKAMHGLLRTPGAVDKRYLALAVGRWPRSLGRVEAPLERRERPGGERIVKVAQGGKSSVTEFRVQDARPEATLLEARPLTGRTHQIRVHAAHAGHPLLGDEKYASDASRALTSQLRLKRLFLHAHRLCFRLGDRDYDLRAALGGELLGILERLDN